MAIFERMHIPFPDKPVLMPIASDKAPGVRGAFVSTMGLKKIVNEDRLGSVSTEKGIRICLCDGHWGEGAAQIAYDGIMGMEEFPSDPNAAASCLLEIEKRIFDKCGNPNLNGVTDTTSETSLIAFEVSGNSVRLITYGDCRFFLLGRGYSFRAPMIASWLGSFSYLRLRARLPVEKSFFYTELPVAHGDVILFFTDGIDECVYERSTISFAEICETARRNPIYEDAIRELLQNVFDHGAEDNASIGILRIK